MNADNTVKLSELIHFVQSDGRVCLMPVRWNELWELIRAGCDGPAPPMPLILSGWDSPPEAKRQRLEEQLRYAAEHDALDAVECFLRDLKPEDWSKW